MMERCAGCGAPLEGGMQACQERMDAVGVAATTAGIGYPLRRLMIDTYCLQHPDRYCVSGKSLAAHLTGAAWQLDLAGGRDGLDHLQRWLDGPRQLPRPPVPADRGRLTVVDFERALERDGWPTAIDLWARSTWLAYAPLRTLAYEWIAAAGLPLIR